MRRQVIDIWSDIKPESTSEIIPTFPKLPLMIVIGIPGAGKSKLVSVMMQREDCFKKKFDFILYVGKSDIDCLKFDESYCSRDFSIEWCKERLEYYRDLKEEADKQAKRDEEEQYNSYCRSQKKKKGGYSDYNNSFDSYQNRQNGRRVKQLCADNTYNDYSINYNEDNPKKANKACFYRPDPDMFPDEARKAMEEDSEEEAQHYMTREAERKGIKIDNNNAKYQALIIIDDEANALKADEQNPRLKFMFNRRRHFVNNVVVNFIITAQAYKQLPIFIRQVANCIAFFNTGPEEMNKICAENILTGRRDFKLKSEAWFRDQGWSKHPFIYINKENYAIHKNFGPTLN